MKKNHTKGQGVSRSGWLLVLAGLLPALALAASTQVKYDAAGRVSAEIDANGNRTTYAYDKAGHRVASTDALGHTRTWAYDANGNLVSETDALGHITTYTLDELSHRTQTTYADGAVEATAYDALGRVTAKTDANQRTTHFAYDALGRLTQVTDALGQVTAYGYDEQGRKVRQTDANGHTTAWTVDANGQVLTHTLPLGQVESFRYDANGNVLTHTDFNGQVTTYSYDVDDRVSDVRYADTGRTLTTYDAVGNRLRVDDTQLNANGVAYSTRTTYAYDARDRLLTQTNPDGSGLAYAYDGNGNRTQVTAHFPNGSSSSTSYGVDALNRVVSVIGPEGESRYAYDADGNQTMLRYGNGAEVHYAYDARHRLVRQEHFSPAQALTQRYVYGLDATGRRLTLDELDGRHTQYRYDELYRLIAESQSGGSDAALAASYQYDPVGNRTYSTIDGVQTAYRYDANDRLMEQGGETYTYDAAGNLLTQALDGQTTTYGYDARGQLNRVSGPNGSAQYLYDADHNRIQASGGGTATAFLIDSTADYPQVVAELNNGVPQIRYTLGHERLAQATASDFHFYETDGHGSVRALTGSDGSVTDRYRYDAFGNMLAQSGSTPNDFRYTGEQFDSASNLYYLRARYYSAHNGRFTQRDSYEGKSDIPIALNHYIYANADPVNGTDPTGYAYSPDFGREAERYVCDQYRHQFGLPGRQFDNLWECGKGQPTGIGTWLKPDIFDFIRKKYAEVKPLSPTGVPQGIAQLSLYTSFFGPTSRYQMSPEFEWVPAPTRVSGRPVFFINLNGLIFYTDDEQMRDAILARGVTLGSLKTFVNRNIKVTTVVDVSAVIAAYITAGIIASQTQEILQPVAPTILPL